ncbi:hypothetical protein GCM10009657_09820 [Oryzihumus leptocrescens]
MGDVELLPDVARSQIDAQSSAGGRLHALEGELARRAQSALERVRGVWDRFHALAGARRVT